MHLMDSDGSDTEDLTQDQLDTRVLTKGLLEERIWDEEKVDVPEDLLKGIEAGWQEAKQGGAANATDADKGVGSKRTTATAMKAVRFVAETKERDGRSTRIPRTSGGRMSSRGKMDLVESSSVVPKKAASKATGHEVVLKTATLKEGNVKAVSKVTEKTRGLKAVEMQTDLKRNSLEMTKKAAPQAAGSKVEPKEAGSKEALKEAAPKGGKVKIVRKSLVRKATFPKVSRAGKAELLQVVNAREVMKAAELREIDKKYPDL